MWYLYIGNTVSLVSILVQCSFIFYCCVKGIAPSYSETSTACCLLNSAVHAAWFVRSVVHPWLESQLHYVIALAVAYHALGDLHFLNLSRTFRFLSQWALPLGDLWAISTKGAPCPIERQQRERDKMVAGVSPILSIALIVAQAILSYFSFTSDLLYLYLSNLARYSCSVLVMVVTVIYFGFRVRATWRSVPTHPKTLWESVRWHLFR
jgi:hypothetical protein